VAGQEFRGDAADEVLRDAVEGMTNARDEVNAAFEGVRTAVRDELSISSDGAGPGGEPNARHAKV
jgi:hypothetical protein